MCLIKHPATAIWGGGGIAWHILNFYTRYGEWSAYRPQQLYCQEKGPWFPLDRGLKWSHNQSGHCSQEKNLYPCQELNPWPSSHILTEPYLLWITTDNFIKCGMFINGMFKTQGVTICFSYKSVVDFQFKHHK